MARNKHKSENVLRAAFCLSQYLDYKTTRMGIESGHLEEANPAMRYVLDKFGWKGFIGAKALTSLPVLINGNAYVMGSLTCIFSVAAANNYRLMRSARKKID